MLKLYEWGFVFMIDGYDDIVITIKCLHMREQLTKVYPLYMAVYIYLFNCYPCDVHLPLDFSHFAFNKRVA